MRMRKKKNLDSRMEACSQLWIRDPETRKGRWRELKPGAAMLRLELGCGKGRFTAETAAAHPEDLYVAVERVADAMVIAMERCRAMGLTNVFFIDGDAAVLSDYFAPDEVDLIYINFCDPWPSVKHSRRRLTHECFLRSYRKVLRDGGQIHFKSDNHDLFEWSLFQFPKAGFALSEVTRNLHEHGICGIMTDYEEKFHNLGTPINRCVGTKTELPDAPLTEALEALLPRWELKAVTEGDIPAVLALMESNGAYYEMDGFPPSEESIRHDMAVLPPRCIPDQKTYCALWQNGKPLVLLDLIEGYPRERTLFIGFFMVAHDSQGKGVGSEVASAISEAAAQAGYDEIRLACLKANEAGHRFWEKMGFHDIRESETADERKNPVWIMEKLTG
ncbi:MAG: tRNA (guanosine(46)-N7)-methyltransferase TrmB [Oscillospiraceae bacterium]|nr:tRNA (guanosine(46)-N7)-methyltransferase TrmB [Oscillospiraceae bacterium]